MKLALIGAALAGVVALNGCAMVNGIPTTNLTPAAQADLQAVLDSYCPVLGTAQGQATANPSLDTTDVAASLKLLALACPPNPAPTNGAVALVDLVNAYVIIEPLLPKAKAAHARATTARMKAKYRLQ